jgi:probable F420-dependent oxidoreductase
LGLNDESEEETVKFWQNISYTELDQLPEIARLAEAVGFHGLAISDHLVTPREVRSRYPYTEDGTIWWDPEAPYPEPWTTAAWLGAMTERLHFMSYVYILGTREPFGVAKLIATAACLTNNRVTLGVGVGWMKDEFDLVGQEFANRGNRADEMLQVISSLLEGKMASFDGKFYSYPPVQMSPVPSQQVPVLVGGNSEPAMRRAARNDGWLGIFIDPEDIHNQLRRLDGYRSEYGTNTRPFEMLVFPTGVPTPDVYRRLADAGVTAAINPPWYYTLSPTSSLDAKRREIEKFAAEFIDPLGD